MYKQLWCRIFPSEQRNETSLLYSSTSSTNDSNVYTGGKVPVLHLYGQCSLSSKLQVTVQLSHLSHSIESSYTIRIRNPNLTSKSVETTIRYYKNRVVKQAYLFLTKHQREIITL